MQEQLRRNTQENQPKLAELREGTWAYAVDIFEKDDWGHQQLLSLQDMQARLNQSLATVREQGGRVVQLLEVEVEGEVEDGVMGGGNTTDKAYILIVEKS